MKKFDKRFLAEVCGFNNEEIDLVMKAQRLFPEFLVEDGKGFCVDGRILHKTLEVKQDFSDWIKKQFENIEAKESIDFTSFPFKREDEKGWKSSIEYSLTVEIAKEIAMFSGANNRASKELKENSKLVRKYFMLLEQAIKTIFEHKSIRPIEKQNYNIMKDIIIKDYENKHLDVTDNDRSYLLSRECIMLDKNLTGYTPNEIKIKLGYLDKETREHLQVSHNQALNRLQEMITDLVIAGVNFEERSKIIENICKNKYPNLKMN